MTLKYLRMNSIRLSQELFRHLSFIVVVFLPYEHSNMCLNGFLTQSCAIHVLVLKSHTRVAPYKFESDGQLNTYCINKHTFLPSLHKHSMAQSAYKFWFRVGSIQRGFPFVDQLTSVRLLR